MDSNGPAGAENKITDAVYNPGIAISNIEKKHAVMVFLYNGLSGKPRIIEFKE